MGKRRRFKQTTSLKDRLSDFMTGMRERADIAPPGPERDELLKNVKKAEVAMEIERWASSPELQPPK